MEFLFNILDAISFRETLGEERVNRANRNLSSPMNIRIEQIYS